MNSQRLMTIRGRLSVLATCTIVTAAGGCQGLDSSEPTGGPFGEHLPQTEAEFTTLGEAALQLNAEKAPLQRLDPVVGKWLIEGTFSPWPGSPVSSIAPICESKWILGGRCLQFRYRYSIPGEVISDLVIVGWNSLDHTYSIQLYSSGWPLPTHGTGQWNEETNALDFVIHTINPSTKQPIKTLYRLSDINPESHRWSQFRTKDNGELEAFFIMNAKKAPAQ
ncbi:MAG: DUF1579 family protein [Planctomycetota bacterium]|nr:DUF1579 family protein [Planctomycetota bacterium]